MLTSRDPAECPRVELPRMPEFREPFTVLGDAVYSFSAYFPSDPIAGDPAFSALTVDGFDEGWLAGTAIDPIEIRTEEKARARLMARGDSAPERD